MADFGLLTFVSDPANPSASISTTNLGGTTRWMSPELLHPELFGFADSRLTKESDCYALGMVILEVLTGQVPFACYEGYVVMRKVVDGERPERPKGAWFTDDLWGTLELCWSSRSKGRPTVEAVLECLERVSLALSTGLKKRGNLAVASGGFTDIWRGDLGERRVAIKVFREYPAQTLEEAKKVNIPSACKGYSPKKIADSLGAGTGVDVVVPSEYLTVPWRQHYALSTFSCLRLGATR